MQSANSVTYNTELLGPSAFLKSLPQPLPLIIMMILIFSTARFLVDGIGLELAGRSLSQGGDFQPYYIAARMVRDGLNIYDTELAVRLATDYTGHAAGSVGYLYPPLLAMVIVPLSFLPYVLAYKVWVVLQVLSLFAAIYFLAYNLPALGKWAWPFLYILATNMYPVYLAVDMGQVNLTILLIIALALHFARRGQFWWAGAVIGIGGMIKIVPLLLLGFFFLQKQWKVVLGCFAAIAILVGFSILIIGPTNVVAYFANTLSNSIPSQVGFYQNASLHGIFYRLTNTFNIPQFAKLLTWGSVFVVLGVLGVISLIPYKRDSELFSFVYSIWVVAIFLVSPTTWEHNLPSLLVIFGAVAAVFAKDKDSVSIRSGVLLGVIYSALAFENLFLNRFGQWQFERDYGFITGEYLQFSFFADVRFVAFTSLAILSIFILKARQPDTFAVLKNLRHWINDALHIGKPTHIGLVQSPREQE